MCKITVASCADLTSNSCLETIPNLDGGGIHAFIKNAVFKDKLYLMA